MSLRRQNSLEQIQSHLFSSRLNYKQTIIRNLQTQLSELTHSKHNYNHTQQAIHKLLRKIQDAHKQKAKTQVTQKQANRNIESTINSYKKQFQNLSLSVKSKESELADLILQKNDLAEKISMKNIQIQRLRGKTEIDDYQKKIGSQCSSLISQKFLLSNQVKDLQRDLQGCQKTNKQLARDISKKEAAVLSLRLQIQNKDRKLDNYERENNNLDEEVGFLIKRQSETLKQICDKENILHQLELQSITLKSKVKAQQKQLQELNKMIRMYQKQKNRQGKQNIKNKQQILKKISDAEEVQHKQINAFTSKNAEIAEINNILKSDSVFCEDHLSNVRRCNQLMVQFLEKCKGEDTNLIEMLQKRLIGTETLTQKSAVNVQTNSKIMDSRSTQNSWLNL